VILEPVLPEVLSVRQLNAVDPALLVAYGAEPARHSSLGLLTCTQDDPTYVALDEATKHADVEVVYARSFYAGAAHASGPLSGEILGAIAGPNPTEVQEGLRAALRCLEHDACFYTANEAGTVAVFPHVVTAVGRYLAREGGLREGESLAYLVAPPLEATVGFDQALKAADVRAARVVPPPTETNFAACWLTGDLSACQAAAVAFAEAVVKVARAPREDRA
jgi:ethanolamine utilization protein EutL